MAEELDEKDLGTFIQVDAVAQLLIEKGAFTELEFHTKLRQVQMEYTRKKALT